MKIIWHKNELSLADELLSLVPSLTSDFLSYHTDYQTLFNSGKPYINPTYDTQNEMSGKNSWRTEGIRYILPEKNIEVNFFEQDDIKTNFPTATNLTKKYLEHCGCSGYSSVEPYSFIRRHSDLENRKRRFVRIHIPLIIPEGDSFIEVDGNMFDWSDIFAFDNESYHSVYNNTPHRRLIYIIDLSRELLGIPPEEPCTINPDDPAPPFKRI